MTAKEFLKQYHSKRLEIKSLDTEIEKLETVLTSGAIRYDKERVQSSSRLDRDRILAEIADQQVERKQLRAEAELVMCEVADVIHRVEPAELSRVLHLRYIDDKKWNDIAAEMQLDERWVFRLHGRALEAVDKIRQ